MKNTSLLIFLFTFFTLQLFSQDYEPMLKEGSFWDVAELTRSSRSPCSLNSITRDQIGKDTIIADKTYKKIKRYPVVGTRSGFYNCLKAPYIIDKTNYNFSEYYFREDIAEKKIYRLRIEINEKIEEIYYDFSLKVGDTLKYNVFWNKEFSILKEIEKDSNGKKKFIFDNSGDGTIGGYFYTEGLGGKFGFFHRTNYDWMDVYPDLNCFGYDMINNSCNITLDLPEFIDNISKLQYFPNPVKNILSIKNKEDIIIKIYSVAGSLLKNIKSNSDLEIDLVGFKSGIYIIEISSSAGSKRSKLLKL
jgi:hypothetical protein